MLTIFGGKQSYCDGISRRGFLKVGATVAGGLTLADLLRAEAQAGTSRKKAIINIYLGGGPTHMDTFDLKPNAPSEYRGEFRPIETNVPGMEICELLPNLAKNGDKLAIIRSADDVRNEHNPSQSDSGWSQRSLSAMGGRPGLGAVVSKLWGMTHGEAPTSVSLTGFGGHGFLPPVYRPFRPDREGRSNLSLHRSISADRLQDRRALLAGLDRIRREADQSQMMEAMDHFTDTAVSVVTSGKLADALDTSKEDPKVIERYGFNDRSNRRARSNDRFLLARRLVECGVRVVGLSWGGWDTHSNNFKSMKDQLPALDQGLSALLEDLDSRGMLEDTMVVMSGEFGRTPRINKSAGRDHWSQAAFWLLAGGGLKTGQIVGATTPRGERPADRPVHLQQIYATIYQQMGINPKTTTIADPNGRPQYLVEHPEVISELL